MLPGALLAALLAAAPPETDLKKRAEELVPHLGNPSFRDREQAARELLAIGYPAKDAVLAGQKSKDAEVSDRCLKLYPIIWRTDLERRVQKFLDAPDGAVPADLPGATKWFDVAGDGKESRHLYTAMVTAHPELLLQVELQPERLSELYTDFARDHYARTVARPASGTSPGALPNEADVLLFLFLGTAGDARSDVPRGVSPSHIYRFLNAPALLTRLGPDSTNEPVRRLYAAWLEKERYTLILRRSLDLAVMLKVKECAPAVAKIANDPRTVATVRATAMLGLGRLGTRDDVKELAPLLKDEAQVCQTVINKERATVQMRDVALAAAITLAGQNPNEFGFERLVPAGVNNNRSYVYCAFTSDDKRAAAHDKWAKWAATNLKK
jgi:hypothetical protein